jgi:hypothetical protein
VARISLVLSVVALTVALLGATPLGEAAREVVLPRGAVGTEQLRDGAVTGAKVKDRSLAARDFGKGQLPRGATGPAGPPGTIEGVAAAGDLTGTYPGPVLAQGSVAGAEVEDGSLRLADTAVVSGQTRVDVPSVRAQSCVAASAAVPGVKPYDRTLVLPTHADLQHRRSEPRPLPRLQRDGEAPRSAPRRLGLRRLAPVAVG